MLCLQGLPNVLTDTSCGFTKQQYCYYIRFQLMKFNKHLDFPSTSKLNEDGVRDCIHDMEHEIAYVGKVGLVYLTTCHDAKFEIADGYYVNGRRNDIIYGGIRKCS